MIEEDQEGLLMYYPANRVPRVRTHEDTQPLAGLSESEQTW